MMEIVEYSNIIALKAFTLLFIHIYWNIFSHPHEWVQCIWINIILCCCQMEMEIENVKFCSITFINFMAISIASILSPPHSLHFAEWASFGIIIIIRATIIRKCNLNGIKFWCKYIWLKQIFSIKPVIIIKYVYLEQ